MTGAELLDFSNINSSGETELPKNISQTLEINGETLELPDASYIRDANILRDGANLILDGPQGTITVKGYFSAEAPPTLTSADGTSLSPQLVNSFAQSPAQYAQAASMNDESPVGEVSELSGEATITRLNGQVEPITLGTPVYQGDIVETASNGAVNIMFSDDSSFAVSEDARLAIDEYVYDASGAGEGSQSFSVLKGVFVFTSGLVGRDDPDDVTIETPSGSIGIRGTIIAGDVDSGEITVVEGAIVLRDSFGNEVTLANQFETAKFMTAEQGIEPMGELAANDMMSKFSGISKVAPAMFSSISDSVSEADGHAPEAPQEAKDAQADKPQDSGEDLQQPEEQSRERPAPDEARDTQELQVAPETDGSVDQNGDNKVDGTIDEVKPVKSMAASMVETMMEMAENTGEPTPVDQNPMQSRIAARQMMMETAETNQGQTEPVMQEDIQEDTSSTELPPPPPPEIPGPDLNLYISGSMLNAQQDGNILNGNGADNYLFNSDLMSSLTYQNISMFGYGGNDNFILQTDNAGTTQFGVLNGGAGNNDRISVQPEIGVASVLDFSNVGMLRNVERVDLGGGDITLNLDIGTILTNNSDEIMGSLGRVLYIDGDSMDNLNIDLQGQYSFGTAENLIAAAEGIAPQYDAYIDSVNNVTLLVDNTINTAGVIP